MKDSRIFLQLWDEKLLTDPLPVLQTGLAVLLDKPFILVVPPGSVLPENMRRLARRVIEADITDEPSRDRLAREVKDALFSLAEGD
jgi:hypothetical protein